MLTSCSLPCIILFLPGCVPADRIGNIIRAAGEYPTEATANELIARYRAAGDEINFDQFLSAMAEVRQKHKKPSKTEIEAAFRVFGTSPYITVSELKKTLTQFGEKLSDDEIDRLVALVGTTEDGRIDKNEMANRLTS